MSEHPHFLWKDLFYKRKKKADLRRILKENVLFCTLSNGELKYLANFVYEREFGVNESVYKQGDRGLGMYLIASGRVAIKTQSSAHEVFVTELKEGSFLGELALVDPQFMRTANAVALEPSKLIGFFKPDLQDILKSKPAMGVKILFQLSVVLGRRLTETTDLITQLRARVQQGVEARGKAA